jgi:hypothetical protein
MPKPQRNARNVNVCSMNRCDMEIPKQTGWIDRMVHGRLRRQSSALAQSRRQLGPGLSTPV